MYAIIETGGKQYKVEEGDILKVEKLPAPEGEKVEFDTVLAVSKDDKLQVGTPWLENVKVIANIQKHGKGEKIIVFKYKPKKNYRKKQGHRQPYTEIMIEKIEA
ncbi:MAG TPA: 50S ribosomal protein L21 [Thermoanaerobacterales bacterium]|jgi:large subunit ribosomal protein L21|nr:50S ribosomal protein L21 [Thermoanaerobacterales bacterium]